AAAAPARHRAGSPAPRPSSGPSGPSSSSLLAYFTLPNHFHARLAFGGTSHSYRTISRSPRLRRHLALLPYHPTLTSPSAAARTPTASGSDRRRRGGGGRGRSTR